ncbi:hypothetical protein ABW20_dc0106928 [Dactylellina cionopaga]|nr:hypothetical protein ABW20_dc0106928 [Dactylellina cionopaga]
MAISALSCWRKVDTSQPRTELDPDSRFPKPSEAFFFDRAPEMSISTRISIAWAPSFDHSEPTDTLVLTGKTYFVDQRLTVNTSAPKEVSWAFAGTRSSQPIPDKPRHTQCSWTHLVSSVLFDRDEKPVDSGVLGPHPEFPDDPEVALETGSMKNPDTGVITDYEEVWRDKEPEGAEVVFWEYGNDDIGPSDRGFVGVVGGYAIGVGRVDGLFWTWRAVKNDAKERGWEIVFEFDECNSGRRGFKLLDLKFEGLVPGNTSIGDGSVSEPDTGAGGDSQRVWICREALKS